MPDKASKKKTEIPQPRPDIILPTDRDAADLGADVSPSQCDEVYQQAFQSRCPNQEEP